jgi:hypothetical protein
LSLSELFHVHALSALSDLTLLSVLDASLDESLYTPPSVLMPLLSYFYHGWEPPRAEEEEGDA